MKNFLRYAFFAILLAAIFCPDNFAYATAQGTTTGTGNNVLGNSPTFTGTVGIGTGTTSSSNVLEANGSVSIGYPNIAAPTNGAIINGNVSIGTSSNRTPLAVSGSTAGLPALFSSTSLVQIVNAANSPALYEADAYGSDGGLVIARYDGTFASPTALQSGEIIGAFGFGGYNGTSLSGNQALITITAGAAWSNSSEPTYIAFGTTPVSSTARSERMRIDTTGNVGIGTAAPQTTMDINGDITMETGTAGALLCLTATHALGHCSAGASCLTTCTCTCVAN